MTESKTETQETSEKSKERSFKIPNRLIEVQKRILEGQRSLFDTTYYAFNAFQEGRENALHSWLDRSNVVPQPLKDMAEAWTETSKQARDNYRETVERSFSLMENWVEELSAESRS